MPFVFGVTVTALLFVYLLLHEYNTLRVGALKEEDGGRGCKRDRFEGFERIDD